MPLGNQARVKKLDKFESKGMIIFIYRGDLPKYPPEGAIESGTNIRVKDVYLDCGALFISFDITVASEVGRNSDLAGKMRIVAETELPRSSAQEGHIHGYS